MKATVAPYLRPATKTPGGKRYLARRIIARLPAHGRYCEPYAGGLSVLLNKHRAAHEVAGDLDAGLIGFYRVLVGNIAELQGRLACFTYSSESFAWAHEPPVPGDPIDAALRFLARNRMSRNGYGRDFAWSERLRGGRPGDLNAWETMKDELPAIAERLRGVELHHGDALELIRRHDRHDTLFYLDPPYHPETRTAKRTYRHDMTAADHAELLDLVTRLSGSVAISGYRHPSYEAALAGWERHAIEMPNHAGQGRTKQRRVEVLWVKRT